MPDVPGPKSLYAPGKLAAAIDGNTQSALGLQLPVRNVAMSAA
jgi:hypothetical protein